MSMYDWAKKEVEIACKQENPDFVIGSGEFDYGCSCYESALKAYKSICDDDNSGISFGFTRNILIRLLHGNPITPIEDTPEVWQVCGWDRSDGTLYQCLRKSSLFKRVTSDGVVTYSDHDRVYGKSIDDANDCYHSKLVSDIVDTLFPITMPYTPKNTPYIVMTETFLSDANNGDYDTKGIMEVITPDKEHIPVGEYWKETPGSWCRIDSKEYLERKHKAKILKEDTKC